jgi:hypothetical protein
MRNHLFRCFTLAAAIAFAGTIAAQAKSPESGKSAQVQKLLSCRALTEAAERLACFDRESQAIEGAIARKDLVFIDRERATATKKALFGFSIPSFGGLFGGDEDEVKQIEGEIASVRRSPDGGITVQLVDKSVWMQVDDAMLGVAPRKGDKVAVKRGTLGSFWLTVNGRQGFKVKRVG